MPIANVMDWEYYNDRYSIPEFEAAWAAGSLSQFAGNSSLPYAQRHTAGMDAE